MRSVPDHIEKPEWAESGKVNNKPLYAQPLDQDERENMRELGKLARHILDFAASLLKVSYNIPLMLPLVPHAIIQPLSTDNVTLNIIF